MDISDIPTGKKEAEIFIMALLCVKKDIAINGYAKACHVTGAIDNLLEELGVDDE